MIRDCDIETSDFQYASVFSQGHRRLALAQLHYDAILPSYSDHQCARFETDRDKRLNNEALTAAIHELFSLLYSWEHEAPPVSIVGSQPSHGTPTTTTTEENKKLERDLFPSIWTRTRSLMLLTVRVCRCRRTARGCHLGWGPKRLIRVPLWAFLSEAAARRRASTHITYFDVWKRQGSMFSATDRGGVTGGHRPQDAEFGEGSVVCSWWWKETPRGAADASVWWVLSLSCSHKQEKSRIMKTPTSVRPLRFFRAKRLS